MIEYIRIKNFKCKSIELGSKKNPLTCTTAITGKVDTRVNIVFDAFKFLQDAAKYSVADAVRQQGGFLNIALEPCPISFEMGCRIKNEHLQYELVIGPPYYVQCEELILLPDQTKQDFSSVINKQALGISVLGAFKNNIAANTLLSFISAWDLCNYNPEPTADGKLSINDVKLAEALYAIKTGQPEKFEEINNKLKNQARLTIDIETKEDKIILYLAKDTIPIRKMLAYFVLVANSAPLIFVQYPENYLPENAIYAIIVDLITTQTQLFLTTYNPAVLRMIQFNETYMVPAK